MVSITLFTGLKHINYWGYVLELHSLPGVRAGETARKWTQAAPVPCPASVTLPGSPPNCRMFCWTQWSAAIWSINPLFATLGLDSGWLFKFKNPETVQLFGCKEYSRRTIKHIFISFYVAICIGIERHVGISVVNIQVLNTLILIVIRFIVTSFRHIFIESKNQIITITLTETSGFNKNLIKLFY